MYYTCHTPRSRSEDITGSLNIINIGNVEITNYSIFTILKHNTVHFSKIIVAVTLSLIKLLHIIAKNDYFFNGCN